MSRAAVRYARAIFDLAKDQNATDGVFSELKQVKETVSGSKDLQDLLSTPLVNATVKKSSLKAVFPKASASLQGLFDSLVDNKRIEILADVADSYIAIYKQDKGSQVATVTTAVPLDAALETQILAKVKTLTGKEASLENIVDESIIGGFVLRIGDLQYNASVAGKLAKLKREFEDNTYVSKL